MSDEIHPLMPSDTPAYMEGAWASCMSWAINNEEILKEFEKQTGNRWRRSKSRLETMIDSATGASDSFVLAFIAWANVNIWGPVDGREE